ncbi:MAG: tetratricopeptide repeat protein [Planctomycetes bacterium]|nr:tetratricopeptide repeat protein [Planctomycetota bacterium]
MIAAALLVLAAACAFPRQSPAPLELDPRTLPHAQTGAWKDFDPKQLKASDLPPGMLQVKRALEEQDFPSALAGLQETLRQSPDFPPAWHQLGVLYFRLQRYGDGAACLERYLEVAPQRLGDTRVLAHCYYSLGDYTKARAHYERVLAVHPDEVEALRGHALSRMRLGEPQEALAELERVLAIAPRHGDVWEWKAQILFDEEHSEEALAAAEKARSIDPFSPRAWFLCGRICADLGRDEEAARANRRFQELNSISSELRQIESDLLYKPGAVALLERIAQLHARMGDVASTRADLARLFGSAPSALGPRIFGLELLADLGDFEAARLVAQKLEQLGADDAATWQRLEQFYARAKDRAKQVEAGERYRRLGGK